MNERTDRERGACIVCNRVTQTCLHGICVNHDCEQCFTDSNADEREETIQPAALSVQAETPTPRAEGLSWMGRDVEPNLAGSIESSRNPDIKLTERLAWPASPDALTLARQLLRELRADLEKNIAQARLTSNSQIGAEAIGRAARNRIDEMERNLTYVLQRDCAVVTRRAAKEQKVVDKPNQRD